MKPFHVVFAFLLVASNVAASILSRVGVSGVTNPSQPSPSRRRSKWKVPRIFHAIKTRDAVAPPAPETLPPSTLGQKMATGTRLSTNLLLQVVVASEVTSATSTMAPKLKLHSILAPNMSADGPLVPIIATNFVIFVAWQVAIEEGLKSDVFKYMCRHFTLTSGDLENHRLHTMLLSGFSHMDWNHLAGNMLALVLSGEKVAKAMGNRVFSYFYTTAIIASDLFDQVVYRSGTQPKKKRFLFWAYPIRSLGASGAVSAVMTYCIMKYPRDRTDISAMLGIKDKLELPAWLVFVLSAIPDLFPRKGSNIAHGAHIGGYLFGACWFLAEHLWKCCKSKRKGTCSDRGRKDKRGVLKKHKRRNWPGFRAQIVSAFRRMRSQFSLFAKLAAEELRQLIKMVDNHVEAKNERELQEKVRRLNEELEKLRLEDIPPKERLYWDNAPASWKTHQTTEGTRGKTMTLSQNGNSRFEEGHGKLEAAPDGEHLQRQSHASTCMSSTETE